MDSVNCELLPRMIWRDGRLDCDVNEEDQRRCFGGNAGVDMIVL